MTTPTQDEKSNSLAFTELPLSPGLLATLAELGFQQMTPIQAQSLPHLLAGRDLLGQSKTGSGKTAAFALPLLEKLSLEHKQVQALVLCPTRELCAQVAREIRKFGRSLPGVQVLVASGGQPLRPQALALRAGVHIVVATPGRALDLIGREILNLDQIQSLVLDEADRMLDMGFEDEMDQILKATPPGRQTLFFSATYPSSIKKLSRRHQRNPEVVFIEDHEEVPLIEHAYYELQPFEKTPTLLMILKAFQPESAIIFCNRKLTVAELCEQLAAKGASVASLHGDLIQDERDRELAKFRNSSARFLIATDVAARGLDIEQIDLVINFDIPLQPEDYIHRTGRTGRAGRSGRAITLVTPEDLSSFELIKESTKIPIEKKKRDFSQRLNASGSAPELEAQMQTLLISGGRKDKLRPGDILGALTGEAGGLKSSQVGRIEIHEQFTYVAVARAEADQAAHSLGKGRIKGRRFFAKLVK